MVDTAILKKLFAEYYDAEGNPNDNLRRLYMTVLNNENGKIILEDLKHRFFIYAPANDQIEEGSRRAVLHIESMLLPIEPADTGASES